MASEHANRSSVDPALAQAAQIPLQSFQLPTFPPEAQALRALTLTCDIKTDDYGELLKAPLPGIPKLPKGITCLTLELFSLGYPAGFLTALAKALPLVKELVVYSQLLGGTTSETQDDAVYALREWQELRSFHLLDVFARPGFFRRIGEDLAKREKGLMFLEINYTFRHEDEEFLARVPATELPLLVSSNLVTCALNIAAPEETNDPQDPSNLTTEGEKSETGKNGVMAFNKTLAPDLLGALVEEGAPKELRMLNCTLYTLDLSQLEEVLKKHPSLALLNATVHCEPTEDWKFQLLDILSACAELEQVEIVGNPSLEFAMLMSNPKRRIEVVSKTFPSENDMESLSRSCKKLTNFSANILRTTNIGTAAWQKIDDHWKGGIQDPESINLTNEATMISEKHVSASA